MTPLVYTQTLERVDRHTYTRIVVLDGARVQPIAAATAEALTPGNYTDPAVGVTVAARYRHLERHGVTHIVDTHRCARVHVQWLHYVGSDPGLHYCAAHITMSEEFRALTTDYALLTRLDRRMARIQPNTYDRWHSPETLLAILKRARAIEFHEFQDRSCFCQIVLAPLVALDMVAPMPLEHEGYSLT